jgi:hypothetical protein
VDILQRQQFLVLQAISILIYQLVIIPRVVIIKLAPLQMVVQLVHLAYQVQVRQLLLERIQLRLQKRGLVLLQL